MLIIGHHGDSGVSASDVDALERQVGPLPEGYRELVIEYGEASYCGILRVCLPEEVLEDPNPPVLARSMNHEIAMQADALYAVPHEGGDALLLGTAFLEALDAYKVVDGTVKPSDARFLITFGEAPTTLEGEGEPKLDALRADLEALEIFDASYVSNVEEIEYASERMRGTVMLSVFGKSVSVMVQYEGDESSVFVDRVRSVLADHGIALD